MSRASTCPLHDAVRRETWSKDTSLRDKLFGDPQALRRTAAFVRITRVSIYRSKKKNKNNNNKKEKKKKRNKKKKKRRRRKRRRRRRRRKKKEEEEEEEEEKRKVDEEEGGRGGGGGGRRRRRRRRRSQARPLLHVNQIDEVTGADRVICLGDIIPFEIGGCPGIEIELHTIALDDSKWFSVHL